MEFQYRFPSWEPKLYQEQLYEYADIAKYWAISKQRPGRPWKAGNFPLPPHCSTRSGTQQVTRDPVDFCKYQYRCSQLRKVIAAFPDILRHPEIWGQCRLYESDDAVMFATNAQNTALIKDNPEEIEFELVQDFGGLGEWNLLRCATRLEAIRYYDFCGSNYRRSLNVVIVSIEGNVVQLKSPGGGSPEFRYLLKDFDENDDN